VGRSGEKWLLLWITSHPESRVEIKLVAVGCAPAAPSWVPDNMFLGRFVHALDTKGRLAIPARFRDDLIAGAVLTRGIDRCLTLYPVDVWKPLAERVSALPISDPDARTFRRLVFSAAVNLELDSQGRILLPPELRAYAAIEREAAVIGVNTSLEIWAPERWDEVTAQIDLDGAAIAERLASLI